MSVAEILAVGGISRERCHWSFLRRRILARFDSKGLDASLPDLALAIGGRFDPKSSSIRFDPRAFREHVRFSLPESLLQATDRAGLGAALMRIGVLNASDAALTEMFASWDGKALVLASSLTPKEKVCVALYVARALREIESSLPGETQNIQRDVDLTAPPTLELRPSGSAIVTWMTRDGKRNVGF